ncbi:MAG: lipoate---protein ligase [bacterium]|nr:MAG: Putative lipoate-protein ligase [bacterium 42_11]MDK2872166.1 lipoate---protein ligase [bacterium]
MVVDNYVDGFLLKSLTKGAVWAFRIWIPSSPFIVLGRFSREEEEIKEESYLPIKRRLGGGCSVVLYPGTIIVSVALKRSLREEFFPKDWIAFFNETIISALRDIGINEILEKGWGDIAYGNKKLGGISLYSSKEAILYQLSLLYSIDFKLISENLKHPPREPDYRKGRDHIEFLTSIKEIMPGFSLEKLIFSIERRLKEALSSLA